MKEVWKDVEGYKGYYQVSNKGRVRSWKDSAPKRVNKPRLLKLQARNGYKFVALSKNGNKKSIYVHRLVAKAFIPNAESKPQVNHKDLDRSNNIVTNLEWCTGHENMRHASINGCCSQKGEEASNRKLSLNDVLEIRNAYRLKVFTQQEIADAYGVSRAQIWRIVNRKRWSHV